MATRPALESAQGKAAALIDSLVCDFAGETEHDRMLHVVAVIASALRERMSDPEMVGALCCAIYAANGASNEYLLDQFLTVLAHRARKP